MPKKFTVRIRQKGGAGSGNWGHAGRPGLIGGSGGSGGTSKFTLATDKLSVQQLKDYERGLYTVEEMSKQTGQYDDYVKSVGSELSSDNARDIEQYFPTSNRDAIVQPVSNAAEDRAALHSLYKAGVASLTSGGYMLNDLGKDVAALIDKGDIGGD